MTPHAHGGASAWDPTYATTPRLVIFFIKKFSFEILNFRVDYADDDNDSPSSFTIFNPTTSLVSASE
jgi:hypothetical protein